MVEYCTWSWIYQLIGPSKCTTDMLARTGCSWLCKSMALGSGSWEYGRGSRESILNIYPVWVSWFDSSTRTLNPLRVGGCEIQPIGPSWAGPNSDYYSTKHCSCGNTVHPRGLVWYWEPRDGPTSLNSQAKDT